MSGRFGRLAMDAEPYKTCPTCGGTGKVSTAKDKRGLATDPPVSQAQRKAMGAAMSGRSNLGIPKSVGKEFIDADPGGKLPEHAK